MEGFNTNWNGQEIQAYTISQGNCKAVITNYGARIIQLWVNDHQGQPTNVVFGYNSFDEYQSTKEIYHGAVIGRYANRIAKGRFSIGHKKYELACNNGVNHLHGGPEGFHHQVWQVEDVTEQRLILSHHSPDGHEGYPGNLDVQVVYSIENNGIAIHYTARCDQETILNITNHAYFNLNGIGNGKVLDHNLKIHASHLTPVDYTLIPTGELQPVDLTPFDFRKGMKIGDWIDDAHPQIRIGNGYDHNFCLDKKVGELKQAAVATGDLSQIQMEVLTTEPGVQLYVDDARKLFCLETQHYPNSPNEAKFPPVSLKAGETFASTTVYRFSV